MSLRWLRAALSTTLAAIAWATIACEGQAALTERNPASEAIWWVSGTLFLLLLLILTVEALDWLRSLWRRLRGLDSPSSPAPDEIFLIREDRRPLRRRHGWGARSVRRPWGDRKTEADPESER